MKAYDRFCRKAMMAVDYEQVKHFAVNDFFSGLPAHRKEAVAYSYARIEKGIADKADLLRVMDYYKQAEKTYRKVKHGKISKREGRKG